MNIFRREFRHGLFAMILWWLCLSALTVLYLSFYPSMADAGFQELLESKLSFMPTVVLQAFDLMEIPDFTNLLEFFGFILQIIGIAAVIYAVILGASSLAREEGDGTIEFLYAKPVSRAKILFSKWFAVFSLYFLFTLGGYAVGITGCYFVMPEGVSFSALLYDVALLYLGQLFVGSIFLCISFLCSAMFSSVKGAVSLSLALFFITYALGIFGTYLPNADWLLYLSPYHYAMPQELIRLGGFRLLYTGIGFGIMVVSVLLSYLVYRKKDFKTS